MVSGDNIPGDAETRRRVRSHAQADYRQRNPWPRQEREVELELTPLLDGSLHLVEEVAHGHEGQEPPNHMALLRAMDASRSDPFASFAVNRDHRSRQLWDYSKDSCIDDPFWFLLTSGI